MRRRGLLLVLVFLSGCGTEAAPVASQPKPTDTPAESAAPRVPDSGIEGRWRIVSLRKNGQESIDASTAPIEVEFVKGRQVMTQGGSLLDDSGYTIDVTSSPKSIDTIHRGPNGTTATTLGIYEIKGDEARLCMGAGKERPKEFSSTVDFNVTVLKRIRTK